MHGALLAIAVVLAAAGSMAWQGEQRRTADAELLNLAGAQGMLSQRVALLAAQPLADDGKAFDLALRQAQDEALRIEDLLDAGHAAGLAAPAAAAGRGAATLANRPRTAVVPGPHPGPVD